MEHEEFPLFGRKKKMGGYQNLSVWQKSLDLTDSIYRATESFPKSEIFGLSNQMRRAAVSVPSNIAEGASRRSQKDFSHFLYIARGSAAELETQIIIAQRRAFLSDADSASLLEAVEEISKMLNGLLASIDANAL